MKNKVNVVSYTLASVACITFVCGVAILTGEVRV